MRAKNLASTEDLDENSGKLDRIIEVRGSAETIQGFNFGTEGPE